MDTPYNTTDVLDHGCVLILGNGFDLDLKFKTSYENFVENTPSCTHYFFPFVRGGHDFHKLGEFVLDATIHKWFDLEDILAQYGSNRDALFHTNHIVGTETENRTDFQRLVNGLKSYLSSLDFSRPDEKSVAARLLKSIPDDGLNFPTIYTFNYTDVVEIGKTLGVDIVSPFYVHGSLKNDDIILGVGDYANLLVSADFMYKSFQNPYRSSPILTDLAHCDTLVIFGLSLSQVDYPYFKDFFSKVSSGNANRPYIRIITYDDASKLDILRNLRRMNEGLISLRNYSDFDIIRTKDGIDETKVQQLISHIQKRCSLNF